VAILRILKDGNDEERTRIKRNIVTKKPKKGGEKKEHCTSQDTKISFLSPRHYSSG
jgi:hypothetical protein